LKSKLRIGFSIIVLLIYGLLSTQQYVMADAAPPSPPPGDGIQPFGELTMVQMVAEKVLIDVSDEIITIEAEENYEEYSTEIDGYEISFHATFWMKNQGDHSEGMAVRFPITADSGWGTTYTVWNFSVRVDGENVDWRTEKYSEFELDPMRWAAFDVTFPPGEEVVIEVSYSTVTMSYNQIADERIKYILHTGSGWYGPIEHGEFVLSLPYEATPETIIEEDSNLPSETVFFEGKAHWYFQDLEPNGRRDNIQIVIVTPQVWQDFSSSRAILKNDPDNLQALFTFGSAINEMCINTKGIAVERFHDLFEEGVYALERAATQQPDNLEVQSAYTYALIVLTGRTYEGYTHPLLANTELTDKLIFQAEILRKLDPENDLLGLVDRILNLYHQHQTSTPSPRPSYTPSSTPTATSSPTNTPGPATATATVHPSPTITPSPTPQQVCVKQSDFIGWGVIVVVFFAAGGAAIVQRKQDKNGQGSA
jgi:hypothetical protein